ncbi:MAG: hypothetical protein EBR86_17100 [Planctomycetia bacterium]|nr:hypothetical protein [Planctomycetia bacterium]
MAAPTISRCGGLSASWPAYAGAIQYDLQWSTSPISNQPGAPVTLEDVSSPRTIFGSIESMSDSLWYFVRVRALLAGNLATPWSEWSFARRASQPSPPTATITVGGDLAIQSPPGATADLYVITGYDAESQYSYGGSNGPDGNWAAFSEWYEVPIGTAINYTNAPGDVWYRARVRYRGTLCGSAWTGAWGSWSNAARGSVAGSGNANGELGGA